MAVDSNVLIYERIREERRNGRSVIQAIDHRLHARRLATIVDSNVTTLIATAVLFWLGTGPVKGFAVTFAIGIVTTVFTAFTFTRWLVADLAAPRAPEGIAAGAGDASSRPARKSRSWASAAGRSRCRACCRSLSVVLFITST